MVIKIKALNMCIGKAELVRNLLSLKYAAPRIAVIRMTMSSQMGRKLKNKPFINSTVTPLSVISEAMVIIGHSYIELTYSKIDDLFINISIIEFVFMKQYINRIINTSNSRNSVCNIR